MPLAADDGQLPHRIAEHPWYHTLELAPGVTTPGWFDTRLALAEIPFPADLTGKRCLDIGTFDGFWAFEMEKRGAEEVIAIDVLDPRDWDWPWGSEDQVIEAIGARKAEGAGFELAAAVLGSAVERLELNVYDLDAAAVGAFDFVYVGSILLHLRDPVTALEKVREVACGDVLIVDAIDLELSVLHPHRPVCNLDGLGRPWWWKPNVAALERMVGSAGFEVVEGPTRFFMKPGAGQLVQAPRWRRLRSRAGREAAIAAWRGDPHAAVLCRRRATTP